MAENQPEDSMAPPPDLSPVKQSFRKSSEEIDNLLLQLVNINSSNNILHEPTCMICSTANRDDVEKKWLETKSYEETKKTFKSTSSLTVSNDIIDNHMRNHYEKGIKEIQKIEYINRLNRLNSIDLTTLDRIRLALSMLTERLMGVNSITPDSNLSMAEIEKIKCAETARVMVPFNNLLKLKATIMGEMKDEGELIIIPRQSFIDLFNKALINSKTEEEKEIIDRLLTSLTDLSKKTQ